MLTGIFDVGGVRILGDELKCGFRTFHLDAVGALALLVSTLALLAVGALDDALFGAGCLIRAELLILDTSILAGLLVLADTAISLHFAPGTRHCSNHSPLQNHEVLAGLLNLRDGHC